MKIFISWSGARSQAVAELLSDWLSCVIQASQPWVSTKDIDRGAIWFSEINEVLRDTTIGVVCLTQENIDRPWILFETGALARGLNSNRVCTLLVDIQPIDIKGPLAQFNHTQPNEDGMWKLLATINASLAEKRLEEKVLQRVFHAYWPKFEEEFSRVLQDIPMNTQIPPRDDQDLLTEILTHVRGLSNRVNDLETSLKRAAYTDPNVSSALEIAASKSHDKYFGKPINPGNFNSVIRALNEELSRHIDVPKERQNIPSDPTSFM